jgi:toxin ParE1/3/4
MVREIRVTELAYDDLLEIWLHIALDNQPAADRWVAKIEKSYRSLQKFPFIGRIRDEFGRNVRSYPVGNYLIFYKVDDDSVVIHRIIHGARDLDTLIDLQE